MKAVVQVRVGEPPSTFELRDIPAPKHPGDDNVIIDIDLASMHHGDLFMSRKETAIPDSPGYAMRGNEAVGRIAAIGSNAARTSRFKVGDRVTTYLASYAWSEQVECPEALILEAPDDIPDTVAAQLYVNTVTAFMVFRAMREALQAQGLNGPVLLTGASSAVGRILAHLSREAGLDVIGLTRSEAAARRTAELVPGVRFFATATSGWLNTLEAETGGRQFAVLGDCVSGALLTELDPLIANSASIITYGGLDPNPIGITGLQVASRGIVVRGIPIFLWFNAPQAQQQADIADALALGRAHPELFPTGGVYDLADWAAAVTAVEAPGRDGFVFLKMR
ncbi:alcohol dehydrogenase catalytic domain-containing protein [Sphingomonas sp. TX0543]|uniref:alcohol dehydrogenase catalytic domain-containing protein n=1 Tax=Sphingomonas sp. TX0543 TaxID=3399682 RepID=UPI003AFB4191